MPATTRQMTSESSTLLPSDSTELVTRGHTVGTPDRGKHKIVTRDPGSSVVKSYRLLRTVAGELPVLTLEVLHEGDQGINTLFRESIVDRRPHAPDRTMSLQPIEPGSDSPFHEELLQ